MIDVKVEEEIKVKEEEEKIEVKEEEDNKETTADDSESHLQKWDAVTVVADSQATSNVVYWEVGQ